jgi:predicted transcriptional regulator
MGNKIVRASDKKKVNLDLSKYVNTATGELLTSELRKDKMVVTVTEEGNYVVITSDDYVVLDCKTVNYLSEILSRTEMNNVLMMTTDLKTPLNIVYNGPQPHSNESLQKFLGYSSKSTFIKLLQKLMKAGVIYQIKGNIAGEVRVIYMMNPFLARKRKTIDKEVFNVFNPFLK